MSVRKASLAPGVTEEIMLPSFDWEGIVGDGSDVFFVDFSRPNRLVEQFLMTTMRALRLSSQITTVMETSM